jgi:uncharacterized protein
MDLRKRADGDERRLARLAFALSTALLVWSGVANLGLGERFYVGRNLLLTAALLVAARGLGLSAAELGLARPALRPGWRWGAGTAVVVAAVLVVAVAAREYVGPVATLLGDQRAALPPDELRYHAAVRIPLGTAVFEEVAFRGVLFAVLARVLRPWTAVTVSSAVFGLWHVAPTIVGLRINEVVPASPEGVGAIVGAVVVTSVAGVGFCWLRLRSGSLLAPILAHWATNALGLLAAAVTRTTERAAADHGTAPRP